MYVCMVVMYIYIYCTKQSLFKIYRFVNEYSTHKPTHLLHRVHLAPPVLLRLVALHGVQDTLVHAEAAADVNLALVRDDGTPEPGLQHVGHGAPFISFGAVAFN